jgi:hypothetical protein
MTGIKKRLEHTEKRLSELIAFFSRVASNPSVLAQMVSAAQQSQAYLADSDSRRKKRRADGETDDVQQQQQQQQLIPYQPVDVAGFFQNLLISPLPDGDAPAKGAGTDGLEAHFGNINLAGKVKQEPGTAVEHITIQEHSSSGGAFAIDDDTVGTEDNYDICVPTELAAGIPSIGVPSPLPVDGDVATVSHADNTAAAASVSAAPVSRGAPHVFATPLSSDPVAHEGTKSGSDHQRGMIEPFDGNLPPPDAAPGTFSFDDIDIGGDLSLDGPLEDIFKGGGSFDLPDLKDESWRYIMDDLSPSPAH